MKAILFFMLISVSTYAQSENWFVSESDALAYAQKHDAHILMIFAGSDWCRPCIKFKKEILLDPLFQDFAQNDLAILYLDFPSKKSNRLAPEQKQRNEKLADVYNRSGSFPKIILFDAQMKKIKDLDYKNQTAQEFTKLLSI